MTPLTAFMQILFIIGILLIIINLVQAVNTCDAPKTIYRYIPRTFIEEQENPVPLDDLFYSMFQNPSPWVASLDVDRRRRDLGENLNRYYVSQI